MRQQQWGDLGRESVLRYSFEFSAMVWLYEAYRRAVDLLLKLLKPRRRYPPPRRVSNFTAKVTRMTNIVLAWTDPTTRVDGSALAPEDIAGIELFMLVAGAPEFTKINTVAAGVQTFAVTDLPPGSYEFQADVVDKQTPPKVSAAVSANAEIVVPPVELAAPSSVGSFTATVV